MPKLREKIDQHFKTCEFHDVRPKTSFPIPNSVLTFYGVNLTSFERELDE